ncbi:MAG: hypothetical protein ACRCWI_06170 [Brevinema sp.]
MNKRFTIKNIMKLFLMVILLASCSVNPIPNTENLEGNSLNQFSRSTVKQERPDVNPDKTFENLNSFIPITEWKKVIEYNNYYHFAFIAKDGKQYWASMYLESDVTLYKVIYLVVHDTKNVIYRGSFPTRIWRKKTDHSILGITPILDAARPETWAFPVGSLLDKPVILIQNGRGVISDILTNPVNTQFGFRKDPKFFTTVQSRDRVLFPIYSNVDISPVFNFVIKDGDWVQFQYTKNYWMQFKLYFTLRSKNNVVLQYRILNGSTVIEEGAMNANLYMTLDRHQSEGSILLAKDIPGVPAHTRWINLFRKPQKGTRGNISIDPIFKASDFQFQKAKVVTSKTMEIETEKLLQKMRQENLLH